MRQFMLGKAALLLSFFSLCFSSNLLADEQGSITLSVKDATADQVFRELKKQTGYSFLYTDDVVDQLDKLNFSVKDASLADVLDLIFKKHAITYNILDKVVVVKVNARKSVRMNMLIQVEGLISDQNGKPIEGVSVVVQGTNKGDYTDLSGKFAIQNVDENSSLVISCIGFEQKVIPLNSQSKVEVTLTAAAEGLDQLMVVGYGRTSPRFTTGTVSKVKAEDISKQPVQNFTSALQGRIPGVSITQTSGMNGAHFKIQLRGQNSLLQGSDPLIIVDGVPYAPGNMPINQINNSAFSGLSPLNSINPSDIESVEVLKDADATAIYGSRGANGVILITTKTGKPGKVSVDLNSYVGFSKVTRTMDMLNTQQYIRMRNEAFANDGVAPSLSRGPDLLLWDTTRYTDLKKLLIGGTALSNDAQLSVSGGSNGTQFLISGGFHREGTVFPTELADKRFSLHSRLTHTTADNKLKVNLSVNYSMDKNELNSEDLTQYIRLPPNIKLYDDAGNLNWSEGDRSFSTMNVTNPLALFNTKFDGEYKNLISSFQVDYKLFSFLNLKANLGYNQLNGNETNINPSTSIDPSSGNLPYSIFAVREMKSWIIEPQVEFTKQMGDGSLNVLVGSSFQENVSDGSYVTGLDYTNDLLLKSIAGAGRTLSSDFYSQYRYLAYFGRINYNFKRTYIINLSGRRDGSSRFGPGKRYSNFGSVGAAWIFSNERFIEKNLPFLSFGKIRSSYGITGNDQIGDYQYLDTWTASPNTYQGITTLEPSSLSNRFFSWEANKKFELGADFGFFKDRVLLSLAYFENKTDNQLVGYTLPIQTGFNSITKNLNALIRNKGFEAQLNVTPIQSGKFTWTNTFNITFQNNKLLDFPGLESSSYASIYTIGESVNTRRRYKFLGIDPETGVSKFADVDNSGTFDLKDRIALINTNPEFFGGLGSSISFSGVELSVFFEFKKQKGMNYLSRLFTPGYRFVNQPVAVLSRWQKPGDITDIQRFSATFTDVISNAFEYLQESDAVISDASYVRCKNIFLSYTLPTGITNNIKMKKVRLYAQAQNVFTITDYIGSDPETQDLYVLPPLRTIAFGINVTL